MFGSNMSPEEEAAYEETQRQLRLIGAEGYKPYKGGLTHVLEPGNKDSRLGWTYDSVYVVIGRMADTIFKYQVKIAQLQTELKLLKK